MFLVVLHNNINHAYAYVGPRRWDNFPRHRWRGGGDDIQGAYVKRMLETIHTKFVYLAHRVPIMQAEDLPKEMQRKVVGVPHVWVLLFRQLVNVVVCFHDQHSGPQA